MELINKCRTTLIVEGIIFIILGILAIAMPQITTLSVAILIGCLFIVGGIVQLVRTFYFHKAGEIVWSIISALVYLAAGVILLAHPLTGALTLTLLLAIFFVIEGVAKIVLSFEMRSFGNWALLLFSGIVSIILAAIIWSGWPGTAAWVIGLLVGINLLFLGFSEIFLASGFIPEERR
jgi:uncharacterized membrane protein HdeD (DUF308 family)